MAVCEDCGREMQTAASCVADALIIRGERFERDRVGRPIGQNGRCGDCGVQRHAWHHLGCDQERCPRCRGQLISCDCGRTDDDAWDVIAVAGDVVVYPAGLRGLEVPPVRFPFEVTADGGPG